MRPYTIANHPDFYPEINKKCSELDIKVIPQDVLKAMTSDQFSKIYDLVEASDLRCIRRKIIFQTPDISEVDLKLMSVVQMNLLEAAFRVEVSSLMHKEDSKCNV
jgi:hypothetical protein